MGDGTARRLRTARCAHRSIAVPRRDPSKQKSTKNYFKSIYVSYRLIKEHDCNIFSNMQKTDFRDFRNLIIDMVLHTDMSQHFSQLKAMKTAVQQHNGESR